MRREFRPFWRAKNEMIPLACTTHSHCHPSPLSPLLSQYVAGQCDVVSLVSFFHFLLYYISSFFFYLNFFSSEQVNKKSQHQIVCLSSSSPFPFPCRFSPCSVYFQQLYLTHFFELNHSLSFILLAFPSHCFIGTLILKPLLLLKLFPSFNKHIYAFIYVYMYARVISFVSPACFIRYIKLLA